MYVSTVPASGSESRDDLASQKLLDNNAIRSYIVRQFMHPFKRNIAKSTFCWWWRIFSYPSG
jgi:hypothetical protein